MTNTDTDATKSVEQIRARAIGVHHDIGVYEVAREESE